MYFCGNINIIEAFEVTVEKENKIMENESNDQKNEKVQYDKNDIKIAYASIKEHLNPAYRKQYNIRRFTSCVLLFFFVQAILKPSYYEYESYLFNFESFIALLYSFIAWKFWHYSFWSYQGKIIDTFSRNIIHLGSVFSLVWRILVQNIIVVVWIAFISPLSGIKTWRKAIKHNRILTVENGKNDSWE